MKINRVGNKTQKIENSSKDKVVKMGDFSDVFDMANKNQSQQELMEMLKDIETLGGRLVKSQIFEDATRYRNKIKDYLSFIIKNTYLVKRDSASFSFSLHTRVEVVNEKLDELTKDLLSQQKDAIDIAHKIDVIQGLLVNVLQ